VLHEGDGPWLDHYVDDVAAEDTLVAAGATVTPSLTAATLSTAPTDVGQWSALQNWPIEAIQAQMLPTGKVLMWDRTMNALLWDPTTNTFTSPASPGYNIFCSGHSFLADGTLLVVGGHVVDGVGLPYASIYDPFKDTWTQLSDINAGRWYPSTTTLANGDAVTLSGYTNVGVLDPLPQVYDATTGTWRDLTTANLVLSAYPRNFIAPNGELFNAGPDAVSKYLDTTGTGQWTTVAPRVDPERNYGSAVMYAPGKILYVGGGSPASASAEVIDLNQANPAWRAVSSMAFARRNCNATLLPDGQVLVTGGNTGSSNYDGNAVLTPEIWNPKTETFTQVTNMADTRWYHSTALLLPDGRVLSAGGDLHLTAEIYSPPYLFHGVRPTITSAPGTVQYGDSVFVGTPDAANITNVRWIRLGTATHAQNWDQYTEDATFTQTAGGLMVSAPPSSNGAPPGYYMLFIVNGDVPSVASIVKVGTSLPTLSASDVSVTEGPTGSTVNAVFTVSLSLASANTVTETSLVDNVGSDVPTLTILATEGTSPLTINSM